MDKKQKLRLHHINWNWLRLAVSIFCVLTIGFGKDVVLAEVTVVETEIGDLPVLSQSSGTPSRVLQLKGMTTDETAQRPVKQKDALGDIEINERHIIQINQTLRKVIEENEKLRSQNKDLDLQLRNLRGQRNLETNRFNTVTIERDAYKMQNEKVLQLNEKYESDIVALKAELQSKEKEVVESEPKMEADSSLPDSQNTSQDATMKNFPAFTDVPKTQDSEWDVLAMIEHVQKKNEAVMKDEAKVHYNMGNVFFKQGNYQKSMEEFRMAVELYPQDANSHFNLAFVSGEYLSDYVTALRHYRWYLYYDPQADDAHLVKERILEAELYLKSQISSPLEKDAVKSNREVVDKMMVP
jgi:tetratricopeptide (TPR) repeat protein